MFKRLLMIFISFFCIYPYTCWAEVENLDEMMARKSRYAEASWGSQYLENLSNHYIWQPETLCYIDLNTGKEIWVLVHAPNRSDFYSKEHGTNAWSCDGSRIGFFSMDRQTANPVMASSEYKIRWVVNSDGSGLRACEGYGRGDDPFEGFGWAHSENAYYTFGSGPDERSSVYNLYKCTIDSSNIFSCSLILNTSNIDSTKKELVKEGVSGNDSWLVARGLDHGIYGTPNNISTSKLYFITLKPSPIVKHHWGIARGCGPSKDPYGDHQQSLETDFHDVWAPGPNQLWVIGQFSETGVFWKFKKSGSYADGGPEWEDWDGNSFGKNEEITCISNGDGIPDNPYRIPYFGHPVWDRWGHYCLFANYNDPGTCPYGDNCKPGMLIYDFLNKTIFSNYPFQYNSWTSNHHSWTGWTDWVIATRGDTYLIEANKWDATTKPGAPNYQAPMAVASTHVTNPVNNYNGYPRPSQSPDGTKVAFAACWLNNGGDKYPYISYAVAYYPYPPEITQVSASGGVVNIRFDWRLDQANPRGYTKRGWPNEASDNPPPPRETEKFKLWRSKDKSGWIPIKTIAADIFSKYDFSKGKWYPEQTSYWEITDSPGNGTFYYAVTAVEHSGLESRTLSNIYKITLSNGAVKGSQDTSYPSHPGGKSRFYTIPSSPPIDVLHTHRKKPASAKGQYTIEWRRPVNYEMIRYYNIYAEDGAEPTPIRQNRIASIPVRAASNGSFSWVDCFGNPNGSTRYQVTSVDYQGNESTGVTDQE